MDRNDYIERLLKKVQAHFCEKPLPQDLTTRFPDIHGRCGQELTYDDLYKYPGLQQALAYIVQYTPSKWLLEQEAASIVALRKLHHPERQIPEFQPEPIAECPPGQETARPPAGDIYDWASDRRLAGICFSGGGIRSATFNLGILQGLARRSWLNNFDYLSSVSGGGYIHGWLAGWLKRKTLESTKEHPEADHYEKNLKRAWDRVTYRLKPLPGREDAEKFQAVWPRQIQWLRRYSNYLTPQVGLLTGDTWSAIAIWIRNVSLNQTLLIAIFLSVLSLPHLLAPAVRLVDRGPTAAEPGDKPRDAKRILSVYLTAPELAKLSLSQLLTSGVRLADQGSEPCPTATEGKPEDAKRMLTLCFSTAVKAPEGLASEPAELFRSLFKKYWHGNWSESGMWSFLTKAPRIRGESIAALACFLLATLLVAVLLRREYDFALQPSEAEKRISGYFLRLRDYQVLSANIMVGFLLAFGIFMTRVTLKRGENAAFPAGLFLLLLGLVWTETFAGGALGKVMTVRYQRLKERRQNLNKGAKSFLIGRVLWLAFLGIPAALAGAAVGAAIAALLKSWMMRDAARWLNLDGPFSLQIVLGTLLFFWLPPLTMIIGSGFIGKDFPDWLGEWLGRIRGYTLLAGLGWVFLCGSSLLMPGALLHLLSSGRTKWPAIGAWILTTAGGVIGGKSSKTSGDRSTPTSAGGRMIDVIVRVGPYVYVGGLIFFLSLVIEESLGPLAKGLFAGHELLFWWLVIIVFAGIAAWLGSRLDINEFSMNSFYRDRLTRCYLGASNVTRSPSPVTGFDERDTDDLQIADLNLKRNYPGPIPIFCCAMNITFGEDLAWQERKAASFAFTPFYSGYTVGWTEGKKKLRFNGFVPTEFVYQGGPNLATAMAASGAAVSPNWGYHTNPATAFLMTMFDVRLGVWVPNPRRSELAGQKLGVLPGESIPASPKFAPWWLTSELFGSVDDTSKYVYLTDGGHFDNMGLYELVRRRCYKIVICDAEQDGDYVFEGIGASIRKCRIDFGVEIELDFSAVTPNTKSKLSPAHIVRGTIRYPETPPGEEGEILYIKASLTAKAPKQPNTAKPPAPPVRGSVALPDVPGDIQNYKLQHEDFPHDSTAEQWFTESQFESYRCLGVRVIESLNKLI
jgi:hypothetical protein